MISRRNVLHLGGLTASGRRFPRPRCGRSPPPRRRPGASSSSATATAGPTRAGGCTTRAAPGTSPGPSTSEPLAASDLSRPLAPLHAHRRRVLALDGLSLATAELDTGGNRHDRGWIHAWTGDNADFAARDTRSVSPSLDQLVAARIAKPDRLPSLEPSTRTPRSTGR